MEKERLIAKNVATLATVMEKQLDVNDKAKQLFDVIVEKLAQIEVRLSALEKDHGFDKSR